MPCFRIPSIFCLVFLCVAAGQPAAGQGRGFHQSSPSAAWKDSDEITVSGVVQEVLKQHPAGGPAGLNFTMTGSQHQLTVNAGPGLDAKLRDQIRTGEPIQVTGLTRTRNGQDYLLAREMVIGGQKVQVRNENGFPVHTTSNNVKTQVRSKSVKNNLRGGAR